MRQVSAREANQRFANLLAAVEGGEQVVISKRGKLVAVLSPYNPALVPEHQAAVEHLKAVMNEPLISAKGFRTFSRDEMHERR
jgi:prevent-host-death family protein